MRLQTRPPLLTYLLQSQQACKVKDLPAGGLPAEAYQRLTLPVKRRLAARL